MFTSGSYLTWQSIVIAAQLQTQNLNQQCGDDEHVGCFVSDLAKLISSRFVSDTVARASITTLPPDAYLPDHAPIVRMQDAESIPSRITGSCRWPPIMDHHLLTTHTNTEPPSRVFSYQHVQTTNVGLDCDMRELEEFDQSNM